MSYMQKEVELSEQNTRKGPFYTIQETYCISSVNGHNSGGG